MTRSVLVVGAGIAGLTAALSLARRGFEVDLLERAGRLDEIGAGIQLSPNALRVLDRLDLLDRLRPCAVEARTVTLRALRSDRELARIPVGGSAGGSYLSVLRADLQRVLLAACEREPAIRLSLGCELTALRIERRDIVLSFRDAAGKLDERRTATLIAADGINSRVAASLGHPPARRTGQVARRAVVDAERLPVPGITSWLGSHCHVVAYPVDGGARTNVVVVSAEGFDPDAGLRTQNDRLAQAVQAVRETTVWPLDEADRPRRVGDPDGLLLIGDAAHAMLPYAAQGAALAIEDGFVAAHRLAAAGGDAPSAWRTFEAERRPRWARTRRRVAFHRLVYHLPRPLDVGRNAVMRLQGGERLARGLDWLYDWTPPPS